MSISLPPDLWAAGWILFQGWVSYYFWTYGLQEEYYFKGEYLTTSGLRGCRRSTISRLSISLLLDLWTAGGVLFQGWVSLADLKGASHRAHNFLNSMQVFEKKECISVLCIPPTHWPYLVVSYAPPGKNHAHPPRKNQACPPKKPGTPPSGATTHAPQSNDAYPPEQPRMPPPCGRTDTCKNITFVNFVCGR